MRNYIYLLEPSQIFSITQSGGFVLAGSEGSGVVVARLQDGSTPEAPEQSQTEG